MIVFLLATSAITAIVAVLLAVVVVAIRQEPSDFEMLSQPPSRIAAVVRRLLGVSLRRPDPQPTDDDSAPSPFHAGPSTWQGR